MSLDRSIMQSAPGQLPPSLLPDAGHGPVSDEDRLKYEQERAKLYGQLDEKVTHTCLLYGVYINCSSHRMTRSNNSPNWQSDIDSSIWNRRKSFVQRS
jgi:hypothetical protein